MPVSDSEFDKFKKIVVSSYLNQQKVLDFTERGEYLPADLLNDINKNLNLLSAWGISPNG